MKTSTIISDTIASINELLEVVRTPIDDDVKPERMKGVLEGRHLAFTIAHSHINQLKDFEQGDNNHDIEDHKKRLNKLVDSTDKLLPEISKVLRAKIDLTELVEDDEEYEEKTKDEKFKSIVMSKKVALDFMKEIESARKSIKFTIENSNLAGITKKNIATDRVKRNL